MRERGRAAWTRVGLLTLLILHAQGGAVLAGALERAMIGKSPVVDLTRPLSASGDGAGLGQASPPEPVTRLYLPVAAPRGQRTIAQIPMRDLLLNAVVIDIAAQVGDRRDYRVSVRDLQTWERTHGRIPKRSMVLLRTGAPSAAGAAMQAQSLEAQDPAPLPGFQPAALAFLLQQREIRGVGQDALIVHPVQAGAADGPQTGRAGTLQIENLTNLDRLPPKGAKLVIAPVRLREDSAPARVFAILP